MILVDTPLAIVAKSALVGKPDERGPIREAVVQIPGGRYLRTTTIGNEQPLPGADNHGGKIRRGDHYHPEDEPFIIIAGGGELYTAHRDTPEKIHQQEFAAGQTLIVPGLVAHMFLCEPGTILVSVTDWPFTPGCTVPCELKI